MTVKVTNLKTLEEQIYTCSPEQAVRSAYALEKGLISLLACSKLSVDVQQGTHFVTCGDWTASNQTVER